MSRGGFVSYVFVRSLIKHMKLSHLRLRHGGREVSGPFDTFLELRFDSACVHKDSDELCSTFAACSSLPSPSECFLKTTNIDIADFMEKLAYLGCSVPKSTASSLAWWVKFLDVPTSFSLTASVIMAEIKSSRKDHEVKGPVQARPFQLCHMRQVESVCVRATNPVHSALAAWVALLAHAGFRAEESQRLKVGSCGFTDVAIHGVCRNPEPRGVSNMPWAALRCGVLDEDWGGTIFCHSFLAFNLTLSFLVFLAISHPLIGVVGPRKTSKLRACGLFSHILKASHRWRRTCISIYTSFSQVLLHFSWIYFWLFSF